MTEVLLSDLDLWYEKRVPTTTLELVRWAFQGNFSNQPTSWISSLGEKWRDFDDFREALGKKKEFVLFLQCQMEEFKATRKGKKFYVSYCVEEGAIDRYVKHRERLRASGYFVCGSFIYRVCYPNECTALKEYFARWLHWQEGEPEPNWWEVRADFAPVSHPFWTTFSCSFEAARERGEEFLEIWTSGKNKLLSRQLMQDASEYDRASIDALIFTACQITPLAKNFLVLPEEEEFSFPYQIAIQLYDRRKEILSPAPRLRIELASSVGNA